tara:strand:+ start:24412 stop:24597 length:186 start_codon:yes stop_codon:yes gene_type:complete
MDEKVKIFKHLQDRLSSFSNKREGELKNDLGELEMHVALTRVYLAANKKYRLSKDKGEHES